MDFLKINAENNRWSACSDDQQGCQQCSQAVRLCPLTSSHLTGRDILYVSLWGSIFVLHNRHLQLAGQPITWSRTIKSQPNEGPNEITAYPPYQRSDLEKTRRSCNVMHLLHADQFPMLYAKLQSAANLKTLAPDFMYQPHELKQLLQ